MRTIRSISVIASNGTTVIPAIPVLLGGVSCPDLVRQLMNLDSWILSSQLPANPSVPSTRSLVWAKVKADNTSGSQADPSTSEQSLDLPVSFRHPQKARTVKPLPANIAPVSLATEL